MVLAFDPNNIPAIVNAIEQVLGAGHPIARTVQAAATDLTLSEKHGMRLKLYRSSNAARSPVFWLEP